jgi:hypothetical protein
MTIRIPDGSVLGGLLYNGHPKTIQGWLLNGHFLAKPDDYLLTSHNFQFTKGK